MSDFEVEDFLWETWISPVKRKRKKTPKKDKTCAKHKSHITAKTEESGQKKKKKKCKNTDATEKRKEKSKEKKEKKNKLPVGLDHSFVFTQGCTCVSNSSAKSKPRSTERKQPDEPTQEDSKNSKRKKKVAWDLPQLGYIRVKRPKFVSSTPRDNNNNQSAEEGAVRNESESYRRQAAETTACRPQDDDSQCTGEDINSQDLFITQKTFRPSPPSSEPSSGETSDKGVFITTQEEGANIHRQQSHPKKVKEPQTARTTLEEEEEEEEERLDLMQQNPKSETLSFQKQMDLNQNVKVPVKPSVVNPYLNEPVVSNPSQSKPDLAHSPGRRSPSHPPNAAESSPILQVLKANISTQTENFFTAELCSFLSFCQKRKATTSSGSESWKPLDLSLPQRVRRDLARCVVSVTEIKDDEEAERSDKKTSTPPVDETMKDAADRESSRRPPCSSGMEMKDVEVKKEEASGRSRLSVGSRSKGKTTESPQSESEVKSANSSEDSELPSSTGKPDLTQVRAVQTRLNESFFFKTKGEGRGLRPESPLMKLAQGREKKTRKSH